MHKRLICKSTKKNPGDINDSLLLFVPLKHKTRTSHKWNAAIIGTHYILIATATGQLSAVRNACDRALSRQEGAAGSNNNNEVPISPDSEPARFLNTSRNITKCHKLLIFYSGIVQRCLLFIYFCTNSAL